LSIFLRLLLFSLCLENLGEIILEFGVEGSFILR
jgi:hypothetical protein